ncbi:hypothetical protein [Helicobacter suis]|nr:hypothetical protein [Helicobacter suis]
MNPYSTQSISAEDILALSQALWRVIWGLSMFVYAPLQQVRFL